MLQYIYILILDQVCIRTTTTKHVPTIYLLLLMLVTNFNSLSITLSELFKLFI